MALPNLTPALHTYPPLVSQLSRKELHLIYKSWVQLQGVSKIGNNMSFYRWTPVRCERPQGVKNPCGFEPFGSNPQETLRIRSL